MRIFRFFSDLFRLHKSSFILNIIGLSLAFSTFYIIMTQVAFDWGFDAFHKDADRIYRIERLEKSGEHDPWFSFPELNQLEGSSPQMEAFGIKWSERSGSILQPGNNTVQGYIYTGFCYINKGYTEVFTFDMMEGTTESLLDPECAIIPLSLAEKLYGKRNSYLGEKFGDNNSWYLRVGGVYRDFPKNSMISNIVYQIPTEPTFNKHINEWGYLNYFGYVKLRKQVDPVEFQKRMKVQRMPRIERVGNTVTTYSTPEDNRPFNLFPLKDIYYSPLSQDTHITGNKNVTRLLFSIALLIVIIAGINFMNFSMALVPSKIKGINTHLVLGASSLRLRMHQIAESLFSALLAFLIALLTVYLISKTSFTSFLYADMQLHAQPVLVVVTLLTALAAGFLSGIYPAYYITSFTPARVVNSSFALSPKGRLLRNGLIGLQFTVSLVMMILVLFMYLQNRYMRTEPTGFEPQNIIYAQLTPKLNLEMLEPLTNKLKESPEIEHVAFSDQMVGVQEDFSSISYTKNDKTIAFNIVQVSPDFFNALNIEVREGRNFRPEDRTSARDVLIVNQTAKKQYDLKVGDVLSSMEVVGFTDDIQLQSYRNAMVPLAFYVPGASSSNYFCTYANIRPVVGADMQKTTAYVKQVCKELDPDFGDDAILKYDQQLEKLYQKENQEFALVSIFSMLIIFISIVGVFGLVIFETQTRRKEVGICKVFGSSESQILYLFNKTYLKIVLICFVIAAPLAYRITEVWMQNFAYRIVLQAWVFAVALLIVLTIVSLTVTVQSWRAANTNPIDSMKN